jgi:hypothetical protein
MACSKGEGPGVRKAAAGSCNEEDDADGAAAGAKASLTAKGSELTLGADGGWPNGSEKAEPFDEIEGAAGAAKGSAPRENEEATDGALGAPSKDDATLDTDGGAGGAPKGSGVAGAGGTEPLRRCGLAWAGEALGSVDELLRVPLPPAAKRLRAAGGAEGGTRPGPDEATDGAEAVPKGSEKALEVDGAGAGADHSAWRRRAISSSVSLGFDALGGGFGGSSSSSDDASDEPSSEDDEDAAGFGERTVRTEGFGADSAVTSDDGADRRGRNDAGGDAPEPERRRTVAETSSTRRASAL